MPNPTAACEQDTDLFGARVRVLYDGTPHSTPEGFGFIAPIVPRGTEYFRNLGWSDPDGDAIYLVEVSGETFRVRVTSAAQIAEFDERLQAGSEGVINGPLIAGDGGFNEPWSWHLDPAEAHTADAAIEVCDGRPSMVEADLSYWIDTLGQFCPWGATVVEKID